MKITQTSRRSQPNRRKCGHIFKKIEQNGKFVAVRVFKLNPTLTDTNTRQTMNTAENVMK